MHQGIALLVLLVTLLGAGTPARGQAVTFSGLLGEMTDLGALTRLPDPPYTTRQFSSYDRKSTDPAIATDENWFANYDRGQYLREEEREGAPEYVLMDAAGPGAVVRIWSANPDDAGICRIYLDGGETPVLELPFVDLLGGEHALTPAPIGGVRGKGWNAYLPIPYARHCKITASKPDFYYQINYRTYAADTPVETFSEELAQRHAPEIQQAADALKTPKTIRYAVSALHDPQCRRHSLAPGAREAITLPEGPAEILALHVRVHAEDLPAALRGVLLEIHFDGQEQPAVQTPLGDFFSTAPGLNPYEALPLGVLDTGTMYSHWRMPYRTGALLRLTNHTGAPVEVQVDLQTQPRPWPEGSLHFHAKWRAEQDIPTLPRQDWTFLEARGAGRFVGTMMHIANPVPGWWGEGDEKIYVDKESFPSTFGTGTEDYFGYAWCDTALFTHAYHNQVRCDGPANYGHTTVNRFQILDNIPFTEAFKFDMEVWHWNETTVSQSCVVYWYAAPGSTDDFPALRSEDLLLPELPPMPEAKRVEGAIEGEKMKVVAHKGGAHTVQQSFGWPWSGAEQLWWLDAAPGDHLELEFEVEEAGTYEVLAVFTRAPDYGIAQLALNGAPLGTPRDFYATGVEVTPETSLGIQQLPAGAQRLRVEITGSHPEAEPRHMFGLDYLRLRRQ